jgi:hypothetical protein
MPKKKREGNFSKCSLFLSSPVFHLISIHTLSPAPPDVLGSPTSECKKVNFSKYYLFLSSTYISFDFNSM